MRTKLYITLCLAVLLLPAFSMQLSAQHVFDDRIDSLQKLITKAPADTGKVGLYLELIDNYYNRYLKRGRKSSDSLAFLQTCEACSGLSQKLNYAYGQGISYCYESRFYYNQKNLPKHNERLQQAFSVLRAANNKAGLAQLYRFKAIYHPLSDATPKLNLFDTALQMAREAGDRKYEAILLKELADVHQQLGKYTLAIKELQEVLELQKTASNDIHYTTDLLSHVFSAVGNHKESLRYAIATLDYCRKNNDTVLISTFYQRLAFNYMDLYNYEKAFYYHGKALASVLLRHTYAIITVSDMADCLIKQQKYQEATDLLSQCLKTYPVTDDSKYYINMAYIDLYYFTGKYREAEKYLSLILQHFAETGFDVARRIKLYTRAGQLYFQLKQIDKATSYSDSAWSLAVQLNSWPLLMENSLTLYKLDSLERNYLSAIRHYQDYKKFSDSIQLDVADKHTIELAVQYETDQKNSELTFLTNQATLHQDAIKQGNVLRNIMI
ncbi:MAG TPA: hypothetical protein VF008_01505, partial [Niastella sp.]